MLITVGMKLKLFMMGVVYPSNSDTFYYLHTGNIRNGTSSHGVD